jgi:hypothetical protein
VAAAAPQVRLGEVRSRSLRPPEVRPLEVRPAELRTLHLLAADRTLHPLAAARTLRPLTAARTLRPLTAARTLRPLTAARSRPHPVPFRESCVDETTFRGGSLSSRRTVTDDVQSARFLEVYPRSIGKPSASHARKPPSMYPTSVPCSTSRAESSLLLSPARQ